MRKTSLRVFFALLIVALISAACSTATPAFTDLPAPVGGKYPTANITKSMGDTLTSELQSPVVSVSYGDTHDGPGAVAMEKTTILQSNLNGQMVETTWGDIEKGSVKLTESYDPSGNLVEGRITLKLVTGSIFQWFKGCLDCTINQSRVIVSYVAPKPGETPVLDAVYYMESVGFSNDSILAMGDAAMWKSPASIFPEFSKWGFWETAGTTDMVITALKAADTRLENTTPTVKVVDEDSTREIIGRQTGLKVYINGQPSGTIDFTYKNNFGHMPNTRFIGDGSLSRIDFKYADICQSISVINPPFPTSYSSLFVFENCDVADKVEGTNVLKLYQAIREHSIDGVHFAIYANGYIGDVTKQTKDSSVKVGEGGGVFYSVIGDPTEEQLVAARKLISGMGRGGVDAVGMGFATETLSGTGIEQYLGTLILAKAKPSDMLTTYGYDAGLLDRSGFLSVP